MGYDHQYYGGGAYGGGGYLPYGASGPLEAKNYLDGPGSSYYLRDGQFTSYASEGYNGSIFEQNTIDSGSSYYQKSTYSYANGDFSYQHSTSVQYNNPPLYTPTYAGYSYGPAYQSTAGVTRFYVNSYTERSYNGNYENYSQNSLIETDLAGGYYKDIQESHSDSFAGGVEIPGASSTSSTSSYGYFYGYA